MSAIDERVSAALSEPLQAASHGGALGYVGLDVPADLLAASGVSCHLPIRVPRDPAKTAGWLESSFPQWAHSILESWWEGEFACFDHVIFSRGDDASHRLYYYICELQRQGRLGGPQPLVFDVARIPRESSRRYSADALRYLAGRLGIDAAALGQGIRQANAWRQCLADVRVRRRGPGSFYERLVRASLYTDPRELLRGWQPEPAESSRGTVILGGSSPPDDRIHRLVEQAGWNVVEELYDRRLTRLGAEVDPTAADLPRAIADRWLAQHFTARDFYDPTAELLESIERTQARAAILWCTREDDALAWRVAAQRQALAASGIAALVLVARAWTFDDGADQEIQSFLAGIPRATA